MYVCVRIFIYQENEEVVHLLTDDIYVCIYDKTWTREKRLLYKTSVKIQSYICRRNKYSLIV